MKPPPPATFEITAYAWLGVLRRRPKRPAWFCRNNPKSSLSEADLKVISKQVLPIWRYSSGAGLGGFVDVGISRISDLLRLGVGAAPVLPGDAAGVSGDARPAAGATTTPRFPAKVKRRLAAVLAADVAGYSRLMGHDEEGTLARLRAHRGELFDLKVREHRGRIVKTTGDGALVVFASVVDAVRCAVEVQRGMVERNTDVPPAIRIEFRIGINVGDIIFDKGDIFGDGVNVAARLEALAEPGGLCISRIVHDHIGDRLAYAFADTGEQRVKNIAQPVRVFALDAAAAANTPLIPAKCLPRFPRRYAGIVALCCVALVAFGTTGWWLWFRSGSSPAPPLSIVVLPFANLSNDPEQDYFADAITDDLTTDLSRIGHSFVISRTTAFTYKGRAVDAKKIGHDLDVRYVLEGSVRRLGEQVQVNVQLIDADSGAHVWADRFDTDRSNLGKAQDEIVGRLAHTLRLQLVEAVGRQVDPGKNPDAHDLVMRGWAYYFAALSPENRRRALDAFEKALALDPGSVDAKAGIATILSQRVALGWSTDRNADLVRAEGLAREATEHEPTLVPAYVALGSARRLQNRLLESRADLERAISLDRNDAGAWLQLGITLLFSGEPQAALPRIEQALALTPGAPDLHFFHYWLGADHLLMNDPDRAIEYFRKACTEAPQQLGYHLFLAAALGLKGETGDAGPELAAAGKRYPKTLTKLLDLPSFRDVGSERYFGLRKNTFEAGLLRAGMPKE